MMSKYRYLFILQKILYYFLNSTFIVYSYYEVHYFDHGTMQILTSFTNQDEKWNIDLTY